MRLDVERVLEALPLQVVRLLRMSGIFLAGGFIRAIVVGEKPSDIDLFASSKGEAQRWAKILGASLHKGAFSTPNAITISFPETAIQFITRWTFTDPFKLIESFDFTIAQAAIWYNKNSGKWEGICSDSFYEDATFKKLVYTSPTREEDAAGSLLRMNKFLGRGYSISDEDLAKVVARVGVAVNQEFAKMGEDVPKGPDYVPYRRVIEAARPIGGGST